LETEAAVLLRLASKVLASDRLPPECKNYIGNLWLKQRFSLLDELERGNPDKMLPHLEP